MTLGGVARSAAVALLLMFSLHLARADDRVGELAKTATSSSNDKARLSAVVALAKLGDKRALKPLVSALGDPSSKIRSVAALGLGRLGHKAALPALRGAANDDTDADVRNRARDAAISVARANRLPDPFGGPPTDLAERPRKRPKAGFGNAPRALEPHPDLYVVIKSSADDSPGGHDKTTRKAHAEILRASLMAQCRSNPLVATTSTEAQRWGLDLRNVDLSVVKMDVQTAGAYVEVEAQLRLAISDDKGRMLSFLSGGAKVQVPRRTFQAKYLPNLRKEALENAMRGMFDKLLAHLRDRSRV